ncbi:MAG: CoA transferase [Anaerolineae bacterium]
MLDEIRVVDLSDEFGLMCGQLLADMGADVQQWVLPEHEQRLSGSRHWQAYTLGKGIRIADWREDIGGICDRIGRADVLIDSMGPAQLADLGLTRERLEAANPGLIHVSITGFGSSGPKAGYAWTDLTATAASGHLYVTGSADRAPLRISCPQAHAHASADAAVAVLIALAHRDRTGEGQHIDIAAQQSLTLALLSRGLDGAVGQDKATRSAYGASIGGVHLQNQFQARDGWVVVLQGVLPPLAAFMDRLMQWVHELGLCGEADLRWDWGQAAVQMMQGKITAEDWAPIQAGIDALVRGRTKAELMDAAVQRRLLIAPVLSVKDVLDSEHLEARAFVQTAAGGRRLGPFARLQASPLPLRQGGLTDWAEAPAQRPAAPRGRVSAADGAARGAQEGPLAGLKVLDLFWVVAGPGATRMLADYGATVVHVESTQRLDMVRNVPPYVGGTMDPERAACHHTTNCNKLNITLDLGTPEGRGVLEDLVRWADVFTESFAPGVVARMGFGYDRVRQLKPDIIMISSCLMGQSGPWSPYAGYGNLAAAVSGFHALTGHPDMPPTGCFGPYTDFTSVRFNALAILGAVRHRERTGQGQFIDMAQAEAALHFLAPDCLAFLQAGEVRLADGNRDSWRAPSGVYPTRGFDRWIAIVVENDAQWGRLCEIAGLQNVLEQGVVSLAQRREVEDVIDDHLAAWTADQDGQALEDRLQALGIPAHRVLDTHDLFDDPQLRHREHFIPVQHRAFDGAVVESSRLRFSKLEARRPVHAPWFGIHNQEVLRELLGYSDAQVARLVDGNFLR